MGQGIDGTSVEHSTQDLAFSAYLRVIGHVLARADIGPQLGGGKKVLFVFNMSNKDWDNAKASFFSGNAPVPAYTYACAIKAFKELVSHTMREAK